MRVHCGPQQFKIFADGNADILPRSVDRVDHRFTFRYSNHIAPVAWKPLLDFETALLGKRCWRNQAKLMAADTMIH